MAWRGAGIQPDSFTPQGWGSGGQASVGSAPCRLQQGHTSLVQEPKDLFPLRKHRRGASLFLEHCWGRDPVVPTCH